MRKTGPRSWAHIGQEMSEYLPKSRPVLNTPAWLRKPARLFTAAEQAAADSPHVDLRERLLRRLLRIILVGGAFAYLPSAYLSIRRGLWVVFAVDTLGIAYAAVVALSPRLTYRVKVVSALLMFYAIGVVLLAYTGPFGAGSLFLFAFVFLTALFAKLRSITIANGIAILTQLAFVFACRYHLLPWQLDVSALVVIATNFAFISLILSYTASYLVRGLAKTAELERELRGSLQESLKELEHRVRNNLQVVSSLVSIRSADSRNPRRALDNIRSGIGAISRTHRLLYRTAATNLVSIDEILGSIIGWFESEYPKTHFACEPLGTTRRINGDFAVTLTIMLNEILANAVKHGAPREGHHRVSIRAACEEPCGVLSLRVADNGGGMLPEIDGVGLQIIRALSGQLRAKMEVTSAPGVNYRLEIPLR